MIQDVAIRSVLKPFKVDNILSYMIRYQGTSGLSNTAITRAQLLDNLIVNTGGSTTNYRLCAAVRVNKISLTVAITGSIEWLSAYGPTSATIVSGTSTTAAGQLDQRPAKNSLASAWSLTGSNESEKVVALTCGTNDYVDVHYSVVLMDQNTPVAVTTTNSGMLGQVYRTYLDGPAMSAKMVPVFCQGLF